jgi:hypothetical protein
MDLIVSANHENLANLMTNTRSTYIELGKTLEVFNKPWTVRLGRARPGEFSSLLQLL